MITIAVVSIGRLKSLFKLSTPEGSMPRLNAVTLDLWDTLITEIPRKNPGLRKHRMNLMRAGLKEFGFDYDMPIIERAYLRSEEFCNDVWSKNRDIPLDDHFLFMLSCIDSELPWKLNKDELRALRKSYSEAIMQMPPVLLPHAREVLEHLSCRGYRQRISYRINFQYRQDPGLSVKAAAWEDEYREILRLDDLLGRGPGEKA